MSTLLKYTFFGSLLMTFATISWVFAEESKTIPVNLGQTLELDEGDEIEIGSPPLDNDDPGTPEKGHIELNLTSIGSFSKGFRESENIVDFNYGIQSRIQLKIEGPYVVSKEAGAPAVRGFGNTSVGVKFRFIDNDKIHFQMAVYPQMELPGSRGSIEDGIAEPGRAFLLPLLASWQFDGWKMIANLGREWTDHEESTWFGGIGVARPASKSLTAMAEIRADDYSRQQNGWLKLNFGGLYKLDAKGAKSLFFGIGKKINGDGEKSVVVGLRMNR